MTLRFRLNLLITLLFVVVFFSAGVYVVNNARQAVREEVRSSAHFALQLVELVLAGAGTGVEAQRELQRDIIGRFSRLESTRHLQIRVLTHGTGDVSVPPHPPPPVDARAPGWFVRLVEPTPMEFRRVIAGQSIPFTEILIIADPSDEIGEVWRDTRSFLGFLFLFIILANVLVYLTLGRDLAPIESILRGLGKIEEGDYRLRLPRFRIAELSRISEKFNHMAEVLLRSREENRFLTQRSLEIQEQERRHLARELHDELGQSLSAIKAVAVSLSGDGNDRDTLERGVSTIVGITERTYRAARGMMQRLRPSVLDELGLQTALQELVDAWNTAHGDAFCRLEIAGGLADLGDELEINLYRIIQEALTNAAKHSAATEVVIRLEREAADPGMESLHVSIADNGAGFDPAHVRRGLGLLGMRERAAALDGEFSVESRPGAGVLIRLRLPVPPVSARRGA
ncbi:MAG TPA: ATP-binding protein [Gammaproteobacteria bacterium]